MTVARAADLWDQISPDVLKRMEEVLANVGRGVVVTPVPDERLVEWEENEK